MENRKDQIKAHEDNPVKISDKSLGNEGRILDQVCSTEDAHKVTSRKKSVASCHSHYGFCNAKVREVVEQSPIPITAVEISQRTGIKHSTVRRCLNRLEKKGLIRKFCYGYYVPLEDNVTLQDSMARVKSDIFDGQMVVEPRLHCLRLRVFDVVGDPLKWVKDYDVVRICYDRFRNGSVQVFVNCLRHYSFDYVGFRLLTESVLRELGQTDWSKVSVTSFEFNNDYEGVRLDGVQAVTLKGFDGSFRRIYNKKYGLRDEIKAVGSRRIEDVLCLLQGGVSTYNIFQFLFMLTKEIKEERKSIAEAATQMHRLVDAWFKQSEKRGVV